MGCARRVEFLTCNPRRQRHESGDRRCRAVDDERELLARDAHLVGDIAQRVADNHCVRVVVKEDAEAEQVYDRLAKE